MQKDKFYGVYDNIKKKVVYIYKKKGSAINQAKRDARNWKVVRLKIEIEKGVWESK